MATVSGDTASETDLDTGFSRRILSITGPDGGMVFQVHH